MENKEVKSYQLTIYSTVTKLHTVQASSIDEARAMGYDIMSPLETGDAGSDPHWKQIVTYVQELPYTLRDLTLEDVAFVDAYCSAVAVAPRAEVVRYVATDPEYRSSREFYDSMSEYYTSITDAHEVWYQAMQFAKTQRIIKTNDGYMIEKPDGDYMCDTNGDNLFDTYAQAEQVLKGQS